MTAITCEVIAAVPAQCLQAPERSTPCPHILYKKAAVAVPDLQVKKGQVICLCLSDLQALRNNSKTKLEEIDQQVTLERTAKKYNVSQDEIRILLQH
ncbi:hypothetical protein [Paraglaciecola sp. L3A3]|uniref:hypothetical protein n=1 Tax=Paraglaciecola sp. L3A3 TaxID=2686358 RepID=UPI001E385D14|nr:hypothetical protein [Paraglaciecola sp. L3A3]